LIEAVKAGVQSGLEIGDEHLGGAGLADRSVVHVAVGVEVRRNLVQLAIIYRSAGASCSES
jgi:hypothetical protein